jgi:hypothetical protein
MIAGKSQAAVAVFMELLGQSALGLEAEKS